ncbi:MAG: DsbA family protein [Chitinophagaceae bacterium]|nr:DsbA family protein [Chitinophagaceae bacterium]
MYPLIIYCYDAYCCWCYGFSPIISKLKEKYQQYIDFEVISGGMILPGKPAHISTMAAFFTETYKAVETTTGITFGKDFLWHIENDSDSDWFPNSEKPAIAMCVFKKYNPDKAVDFAADLQHALFFEGRDLCDNEAYRHLLHRYNIPEDEFYRQMQQPEYKEQAAEEFALCKQLKVAGFPALFLQTSGSKIYTLANGYTNYNTLHSRLQNILAQQ